MSFQNNKGAAVIIAFIAYYSFAKIGLLFAIPPGFASAIWPAAGIGLAAYLIMGKWALLGVFLASTLANYQVGTQPSPFEIKDLVVPGLLALGTAMQLMATRVLLKRFCETPIQATSLSRVVRFLMILGPLSCLVAASFNSTVLSLANDLPMTQVLFIAFTWWIGDSLGVVFFAPVVLSLFENDFYQQKRDKLRIALPATMLFLLVSSVFYLSRSSYEDNRHEEFIRTTNELSQKLNLIENTITQQLVALKGLFRSSNLVSREEFRKFAANINNKDIKIRALAWVPKIDLAQRETFERRLQSEGFADAEIRQFVDGKMQSAPEQSYYLPILFSEPQDLNRTAIGLDVSVHDIVGKTVNKAIYTGTMAVSAQLSLVQELKKFNAVIVYFPYFEGGEVPDNALLREEQLLGMFEVVLELDQLVMSMYNERMQDDFVFQTQYVQNKQTTAFFNQDYRDNALFQHSARYSFFDTSIEVLFSSTEQFDQRSVDWSSWLIIVVGCLVSTFSVIFIIIMTNLSEMLEAKVTEKTKELSVKNAELVKANEAKSRFLANMSHEYRTPLNAIIGFAELGRRNVDTGKSKDFFEQILTSSKFLLGIINNVLDFSKISEQQIVLERKPFNLGKSVQAVVNLLKEKAASKNIELVVREKGLEDYLVVGDSVRIEQIMMNLLDNAVKFTSVGKVTFSVNIQVDDDLNGTLHIVVKDQGIGISQDKIDSLFDSFTQADESTTREFGGTGLGLAIVKELANAMNAKIDVYSLVGQGTSFEVSIPVVVTKPPTKSESGAQEETINDKKRSKYKFNALVVEDNKINQLIASKQLELLKVKSVLKDDGQQGLDYLATHKPDIVFVDLHMPVLDGFSMIREMKKTLDLASIPVVIISASVSHEDKEYAKLLGVNDYVTKPFLLEELEEVVNRLLVQKSQH